MAISKANAQAAVTTLRDATPASLFATVKANPHAFEKHFTKSKARAAAGDYAQGYFKRSRSVEVTSKEGFNQLSANKQTLVKKTIGAKANKDVSLKLGQYNKRVPGGLVLTRTEPVDVSAILDVMHGVLANCQLRQATADPDTRFLAVAPVPDGFVGRSIDADGEKSYDCDYAVVVVNAGAGNPQVVTVFPTAAGYLNNKPLLV